MIYNGYAPDQFYPLKPKSLPFFRIVYTGSVYSRVHQDPSFLFLATKKLFENGLINAEQYRIEFYTQPNRRTPILENESYRDIQNFVHFYDYVDSSKIPQLLGESCILLLLSNKMEENGPKGLISTTKYFEYLAMERPILCVRSDEDLLEASIQTANAGISARTIEETYNFILQKWQEWQNLGYTQVEINTSYTQNFSRKKQAKQFVKIFEKVMMP